VRGEPAVVTLEFTPFVLDPAKRVLLRAGDPQTLTPRALDLLLLLVQQRDRVLSKDEILRTVWTDAVVEESNLNQQVFVLRKALNGDGHAPKYIATTTAFPGLGRFPLISPDSSFVVFSWTGPNPEDAPDLWIKAVDGDALRRLTETPLAETFPAWSPDGRDIAFLRAGRGVFVISVLGGTERKIADTGSALGWTRDGRALLVRDRAGTSRTGSLRSIWIAAGVSSSHRLRAASVIEPLTCHPTARRSRSSGPKERRSMTSTSFHSLGARFGAGLVKM
jgi:hypothetical protein